MGRLHHPGARHAPAWGLGACRGPGRSLDGAPKPQIRFRDLIRINDCHLLPKIIASNSQGGVVMPIDAMLVSAAVISMFLVFAGVLAWGEIQTRPARSAAVQNSQKRRGN